MKYFKEKLHRKYATELSLIFSKQNILEAFFIFVYLDLFESVKLLYIT